MGDTLAEPDRSVRRRGGLLPLPVLLLLAGLSLGPATAQRLGTEFQINTYTTSFQVSPAAAGDAAGNFVVVWQSYGQEGPTYGIVGQRFDSTGSKVGSEFLVNTFTTGNQRYPAVAADGPGNFLVVWHSQDQDGDNYGVFGQLYDADGNATGSEFQVNSYTTSVQQFPDVAADGSGNFVVAWRSSVGDGSGSTVFAKRFDPAGSPVGSEFRVNTYTTGPQTSPAVAADGTGAFVVVWASSGGADYGVFGQRYDSAGTPAGSQFPVSTYVTGAQKSPDVAIDDSGDFVAVWESQNQDGANYGVFGQRFDSTGIPAGSEFLVNTYTTNHQRDSAVAADGSGDFVVVWESGVFGEVFGQRFHSTGDRVGSEFQVATYTFTNQNAAVASIRSGNFVVAWDSTHDGSGDGVFGQRITIPLFADGFELADVCGWSASVGAPAC